MNSTNPIASATEGFLVSFTADRLNVHVYENPTQLGIAAANAVAAQIRYLITERNRAIGIFSGVASQIELLNQLVKTVGIEWTRVIGFQAAENLGADESSPQSQRKILLDHLVRKVPVAEFHGIRGEAANPDAVSANYAALLQSRPPDFAVLEIGGGGELAAIDSLNCDFNDSSDVKMTGSAIALTVGALMACQSLFVIASGEAKRLAIQAAIEGAISDSCPASILRTHPHAHLFIDRTIAAKLSRFI